jgi:ABC-2 type transport system ATP-binding protein
MNEQGTPAAMISPIILAQNLVKWYGPRMAVRDVSFTVSEGEVVGLLGPNGSGKSTIFRILTGYLTPSSGTASVAGFDVRTESLALRHHVGYVPEDAPLYHHMRVLEFLRFMARLKGLSGRMVNRAVEAAAARLQLEKVINLTVSKLSRGYRQRVAIAQALLNEPKLLVLDEPTSGLDSTAESAVLDGLKALMDGRTTILITHSQRLADTADRVVDLEPRAAEAARA